MPADLGGKIVRQKDLFMIRMRVQAQGHGDDHPAAVGQQLRHMRKMLIQQVVRQMFQIFAHQDGVEGLSGLVGQKIAAQEFDVVLRFRGGIFQVFPRPGNGLGIQIDAGHTDALMAQKPRYQSLRAAHVQNPAPGLPAQPVGAAARGLLAVFIEAPAQKNLKAAIHMLVLSIALPCG